MICLGVRLPLHGMARPPMPPDGWRASPLSTPKMNRLELLRQSHQWLSDEDARRLLCAHYLDIHRMESLPSVPEVQRLMDQRTTQLAEMEGPALQQVLESVNKGVSL